MKKIIVAACLLLSACGTSSVLPSHDGHGDGGEGPNYPVKIVDPSRPWLDQWKMPDGTIKTVTDDSGMRHVKKDRNP